MTGPVEVLVVVLVAFAVGHVAGDILLQTHTQAMRKGRRDGAGRRACLGHVVSLTAAKLVALLLTVVATGVSVPVAPLAVAVLLDAAAHYWIDRRFTLAALMRRLARLVPGKDTFYELGDGQAAPCGTGAYAIDQAAHYVVMLAAALLVSGAARVAGV